MPVRPLITTCFADLTRICHAILNQFAVANLTFERVPISRSFAAGRLTESGDALLPGRISLNFAISNMCSEVKMIFPFPQHAWGKRPLVAPSRSHDSVQRISAAASAGSKNSISTGSPKRKALVSTFMAAWRPTDMTGNAGQASEPGSAIPP